MSRRVKRAKSRVWQAKIRAEEKAIKAGKAKEYYKKNPRSSQAGLSAKRSREQKDKKNKQDRVAWAARTEQQKEEDAHKDRERRKKGGARRD
ncbi:hypothetical protein N7540_009870 [Penicillium herquei]|nr:hypothetical protein N7540_009870 [Penicillium herquei]